jgi:hypothetical protein
VNDDIHWDVPMFVYGWIMYLERMGLIPAWQKQKLVGLLVGDRIVHNYAVSKAVEHNEHFVAYVAKYKLIGEPYESE